MISGIKRAGGYAADAFRLLRRHPSLLLVALAMGALSTADSRIGLYLAYTHTGWGYDMQEVSRRAEVNPSKRKRADYGSAKASEPLLLISTWSPSLDSQGTIQFLWALAYGKAGKIEKPLPGHRYNRMRVFSVLHGALDTFVVFLLPLAISTFTYTGYLAVARNVAFDNLPRWWMYLREARRFWRPQMLLALLYMVVISPVAVIAALRPHALPFFTYLLLPLYFLTTLSPYAIIADRLRVIAAVKRSAMTIVRDPITAVLLIVGAGTLGWAGYLFDPWRPALFTKVSPLTTSPFALLPRGILASCLRAGIGSWFSLAAFLWYRDVSMRYLETATKIMEANP